MVANLLTAQDANWDLERAAFNLVINQRPAAIALPQSADQVSEVVRGRRWQTRRRPAHRAPGSTPRLTHNQSVPTGDGGSPPRGKAAV
jgi:hypothetical protein